MRGRKLCMKWPVFTKHSFWLLTDFHTNRWLLQNTLSIFQRLIKNQR
jgi:hypothetical protein